MNMNFNGPAEAAEESGESGGSEPANSAAQQDPRQAFKQAEVQAAKDSEEVGRLIEDAAAYALQEPDPATAKTSDGDVGPIGDPLPWRLVHQKYAPIHYL